MSADDCERKVLLLRDQVYDLQVQVDQLGSENQRLEESNEILDRQLRECQARLSEYE